MNGPASRVENLSSGWSKGSGCFILMLQFAVDIGKISNENITDIALCEQKRNKLKIRGLWLVPRV